MLWLTQVGEVEGYGVRDEPEPAEAGVMLHPIEVRLVFSQGSCPWIMGP